METIAPFRISVCGIEELTGHCETGVSHVLSILDPDWPVPEAFGAFGEHAKLELRGELKAAGRDPARFGIEGWLRMHEPDPQRWAAAADGWRRLGADMVMLYPMFRIPRFEDQIATLERFKEVAGG